MDTIGQTDAFEKHRTSLEQGKNLMRLGLSPYTADFIWNHWYEKEDPDYDTFHSHLFQEPKHGWEIVPLKEPVDITVANRYHSFKDGFNVPSWSLGSLLSVIPKPGIKGEFNGVPYGWNLNPSRLRYTAANCIHDYSCSRGYVNAAYMLVCDLLKKGIVPRYEYPKLYDFNTKKEYLIWDFPKNQTPDPDDK